MVKAIILPHNMIALRHPRNVYIPMAKLRNFVSKTAETMFFFILSARFLTKKYYLCGVNRNATGMTKTD